jgi:hypothetical protein
VPLIGSQEGLVLTITSQDYIVHWLGSIPKDDSTRLVDTTTVLPYQEGDSIYDAETSTEVLNNPDSMKTDVNNRVLHTREVFMVCRPRSPLVPPKAPGIKSSDESESNISPFAQGYESETKRQKQAREKEQAETGTLTLCPAVQGSLGQMGI